MSQRGPVEQRDVAVTGTWHPRNIHHRLFFETYSTTINAGAKPFFSAYIVQAVGLVP